MSGFAQFAEEHDRRERRFVILRLLHEDKDKRLRDRALEVSLRLLGFNESLDVIRADIAWLKDVGAVSYETPLQNVWIAQLEQAGRDHLQMKTLIPGVLEPSKALDR